MADLAHTSACDLVPGNSWHDCDCQEIARADVPCLSCEGVEDSAKKCGACALIHIERRRAWAAFCALPAAERRRIRRELRKATDEAYEAMWAAPARGETT